jgi:hypothetical protein
MRIKILPVTLLRSEQTRNAVMSSDRDQSGMPCDHAFETVTTQAVADEDRGEILAIGLIDGALQFCSEGIRRVMQSLSQEPEVEYISGACGVVTEFTP